MSELPSDAVEAGARALKPQRRCACPICATNEALRRIKAAVELAETAENAWIEHGTEDESDLSYLIDEMRAAAKESPRKARSRIRAALKLLDGQSRLSWCDAVPALREIL